MIDLRPPQPIPALSPACIVERARWFGLLMWLAGAEVEWADYERFKRQIAAANLTPDDYERAAGQIAEALGLN